MSPKGSTKARLRGLSKLIPSDQAVQAILMALEPQRNEYADHAIALISGAHLERALEAGILGSLVKLTEDERSSLFDFEHKGPLSDLTARIKMAFALGIVGPKTRSDLDHIRIVRNLFAHSTALVRFDTPEVAAVCNELHTPNEIKFAERFLLALGDLDTPRRRFIGTALTLGKWLKNSLYQPRRGFLTSRGFVATGGGLLE